MKKGILWPMAVMACLVAAGCQGENDSRSSADADSVLRPDTDGGSATSADAGPNWSADSGQAASTNPGSDGNLDSGADAVPNSMGQILPSGANGLAFDAEGMIWLADLFGNQVLRFDPTSGEILDRFEQREAGPDDIAIDQEGRVFWTGWSNGQIGRIDPRTKEDVIIAQLPEGANSIAFTEDGRLFVGLVISNNGLYEIDPEGTGNPRLITDALGSLNAFAFGPDGFLYGPLDGDVVKINTDTGEVVETIIEGAYFAVRYNENDNSLYALTISEDVGSPCLDKIDFGDRSMSTFAQVEITLADNFVIDSRGDFYVTGFNAPEVAVVGPDGSNKRLIEIGAVGDEVEK